ncbi:DUF1273 domain-containing protein [Niallia sp. FSL W8-0635]|uniref:DUF1273 domain-containing protein n=1 Tax=Niallia sp. FSL W8-0635 TaxID=2975337 RepID=UPI0009D0CD50|nr:Uncharacterized protein conserved in bacteria [Mycobacteroides abscessus subsp. abscessus]HEO8421275.1 DUF1273 domain-containing protein [Yersinia enterocolitica]
MKIAVISGYKPFEIGIFKREEPAVEYIKLALRKNLEIMLEEGLEWVLISGQLGTELWAAEVVFDLQMEEYPDLKLGVITPFLEQEKNWKEANQEWYEEIIMQADFVDSVSKKPYESPQQLKDKNVFLLKKSDALLLFYDEENPGSPKYLYELAQMYQQQNTYDIRKIQFSDLQDIVEEVKFNEEF